MYNKELHNKITCILYKLYIKNQRMIYCVFITLRNNVSTLEERGVLDIIALQNVALEIHLQVVFKGSKSYRLQKLPRLHI